MRKIETTEKNKKFNRFQAHYIKIYLSAETA